MDNDTRPQRRWTCRLEGRTHRGVMGSRSITVQSRSKLDAEVAAIKQAQAERSDWEWYCMESRANAFMSETSEPLPTCGKCGNPLVFIEDQDVGYCGSCMTKPE